VQRARAGPRSHGRLADGHPLRSWPGGQSVYGLWRWGGLVAMLTDQVTDRARLTGLDAVTYACATAS
jgi:hypothetical protein